VSLHVPELKFLNRDFSAGFLDSPESDTIPLGSSPSARNAVLVSVQEAGRGDEDGDRVRAIIRKRNGCVLTAATSMTAATEVAALFNFERETTSAELLAVCNGQLYKWDGVSAYSTIGAAVFSTSAAIRGMPFKNNIIVMDGTTMKRYNGTALFDVGQIAPTAAPGLATTGAGSITGTYEGYVVWYDSTLDHESSPSATSSAVAFAAQQRRWTKPAGAPGSNYDYWRIYARRTDTNEANFFKVADVAIATATYDEQVSDTARVDAGAGPLSSSNNPPPAFAFMGLYKDHGIGVKADESYFYVSKQGDLESWHPSDKFAVERGRGKPLRACIQYGTETLLFKPTRTFRLVGDRLPFRVEPIHTEFGNVSQESGIEVERLFYGWDEQKGPYVTDLVNWRTLADNRISRTLSSFNRDYAADIKAEHVPDLNLVVWVLSTDSTQRRRRTMLAYNYRTAAWCAPITGLEFASLARFTTASEGVKLYVGDYWGRVYRMFSGDSDGAPSTSTLEATVTSATSSTVVASGASFYTTGNGLAGQRVLVKSPAGAYQWRRIQSNTADTITLDTTNDVAWTTTPEAGWTVYAGAIEFYWWSPWVDMGLPDMLKRGGFLSVEGKSSSTANVLEVLARFNGDESVVTTYEFAFPTTGGVWGESLWGTGLWGARQRRLKKQRINRAFYSMQVGFRSYRADRPVDVTAYGIGADRRPWRNAA
jgi:hypothetical protein